MLRLCSNTPGQQGTMRHRNAVAMIKAASKIYPKAVVLGSYGIMEIEEMPLMLLQVQRIYPPLLIDASH